MGLRCFHGQFGKRNLRLSGFKIGRALVVKTRVQSGAVVEGFDVIEDGGAGLGAGGEAMMIDQFVFEAAKEGLDEGMGHDAMGVSQHILTTTA